jgi:cytochrome c-type biogenesis protein CcmH/NrfF
MWELLAWLAIVVWIAPGIALLCYLCWIIYQSHSRRSVSRSAASPDSAQTETQTPT